MYLFFSASNPNLAVSARRGRGTPSSRPIEVAMKPLWLGTALLSAALTAASCLALAQETQNIGKTAYETYCAGCHGISGKGDGPRANSLTKPPADLTQIRNKNGGRFPSSELFDIIDGREEVAAHGPRDMPVWAKIFKRQEMETPPCKGNVCYYQKASPCQDVECFYTRFWRGRILAIITYIQALQEKPRTGGYRDW
jgi:mono/diheme cytochrome c family protein